MNNYERLLHEIEIDGDIYDYVEEGLLGYHIYDKDDLCNDIVYDSNKFINHDYIIKG